MDASKEKLEAALDLLSDALQELALRTNRPLAHRPMIMELAKQLARDLGMKALSTKDRIVVLVVIFRSGNRAAISKAIDHIVEIRQSTATGF